MPRINVLGKLTANGQHLRKSEDKGLMGGSKVPSLLKKALSSLKTKDRKSWLGFAASDSLTSLVKCIHFNVCSTNRPLLVQLLV
jgi:hypothetical protein